MHYDYITHQTQNNHPSFCNKIINIIFIIHVNPSKGIISIYKSGNNLWSYPKSFRKKMGRGNIFKPKIINVITKLVIKLKGNVLNKKIK